MIESLKNIAKKILSKDEYEEFEISLRLSDGCKGEEIVAKMLEKLRGDKPC